MRVKKTSAGRSDKFGWSIYFQLAVILFIIIKIFNYLFWKKNRSIGKSFKRNPMIFIIPIKCFTFFRCFTFFKYSVFFKYFVLFKYSAFFKCFKPNVSYLGM